MEGEQKEIKETLEKFSTLDLIILSISSISIGIYLFSYINFIYADGALEGDIFAFVFSILIFILSTFLFIFLFKKIFVPPTKLKRFIFYSLALINVIYIGTTLFLNSHPSEPKSFNITVTMQPKLYVGDVLVYDIEPKAGSVISDDVLIKSVELQKPDKVTETDVKVTRDRDGYFADNIYFRQNCKLFLLTLRCYPNNKITRTFTVREANSDQNYLLDQAGTYTLHVSMGDKVASATFEVIEDKNRPPLVTSEDAIIKNIPGYTLVDSDRMIIQEFPPLNFTLDLTYQSTEGSTVVMVKRMQKAFIANDDCYICEKPSLQSRGKPLKIMGDNVFVTDWSNDSGGIVYWVSGDAALVVKLLPTVTYNSGVLSGDVLKSEVFKEYLKKYPSTL